MPLIVKPISANLVKDYDWLGRSDPYCIIFVGNEKQRTRTCSGGGKRPTWTDTFQFMSNDPILRVQVWDDDSFRRDDFIGEGTLTLNQFYQNPMRTENQYIDLINRGKSAGRLLLSVQYQGGGGWQGPNQWGNNQWGNQWGNQGWAPNGPGGWGGNQGSWGPNQGGWGGGYQGGYQQNRPGGWGGNQGGWGPNQGWGGNQGGWNGNWGPNNNGWDL